MISTTRKEKGEKRFLTLKDSWLEPLIILNTLMKIPIFSTAILFEWTIAEISVSRVGFSLKIPLVIWIVPAKVEQLGKMS